MPKAIGIIFANSGSDSLDGLAQNRPVTAVPFGGRYRILDFALSSMVNSGISTIGLVTPHQYRPLLDHLGAGKDWFLERKNGGMFILPGVIHGLAGDNHTFCIKDLQHNLEYLEKDFSDNVVISSGNQIYNMNFMESLEFHKDKQADATLIYKECDNLGDSVPDRLLEMDNDQKVSNISVQSDLESSDTGYPHFANMLIIRRELLLNIIDKYSSLGCLDLIDILITNLKVLKIYGTPTDSLFWPIRTVKDYFHRSMDLLDCEVREKLWLGEERIHTKIVDNSPTRYTTHAKVSNSLIASGCTIAGEVSNSIIFRGVIVEQGCRIKNSIIMPKCHIYENSQIKYAILDKYVRVNGENVLKGSLNSPLVVSKSTVI